MLKLRRERFVPRHSGPFIRQNDHFRPPQIDHGLDGEKHSRLQHRPFAGASEMEHIGGRMEHTAQPVTAEIPDNRHSLRFDIALDRIANIAETVPGFYGFNPLKKRIMRHLNEALGIFFERSHGKHPTCIAIPAIHHDRDIHIQDIPIDQTVICAQRMFVGIGFFAPFGNWGTGDAMTDHVIDAYAAGMLIPFVANCRRGRPRRIHHLMDRGIDLTRRASRHGERCNLVKYARGKRACAAHTGEILGVVYANAVLSEAALGWFVHEKSLSPCHIGNKTMPDQKTFLSPWNSLNTKGTGFIPGAQKTGMKPMANPTAAMLVIGDEILSGRTRDANMHHLAQKLTTSGIDLKEVRFVPDIKDAIIGAVQTLSANYTHVFTSGGIGPTHDDITADCIAEAFGAAIDIRADARAILEAHYARRNTELNAARLRMARIPDGAALIDNPVSAAPGFTVENVHVMAGVPAVFNAMLETVLPHLTGGAPLLSETVSITRGEGDIAGPLAALAEEMTALSFGSYPFQKGHVSGAQIVIRGTERAGLDAAVARLNALFPDDIA